MQASQRRAFRKALLGWFAASRRNLPWRRNQDFYRVWISEIMLQQTRVEAVIPYYERFLGRFPTIQALAAAPEQDVLAAWSGLGYYSRARNLQRAAQEISAGGLPVTHEQIGMLPGIGPYTSAAIASIVLGLPHAAVDGNVVRVVSRLTNDASEISSPAVRRRFAEIAQELLDPENPGDFNQAMMELGATVCKPGIPLCGECPVRAFCAANEAGTERELPVKLKKQRSRDVPLDLVVLRNPEAPGDICLVQRHAGESRLAGFWELPERKLLPRLRGRIAAEFSHQIVNDRFRVRVWISKAKSDLPQCRWVGPDELGRIPLSTISRKALASI
jgi:A/G-specific adenine glycosylase